MAETNSFDLMEKLKRFNMGYFTVMKYPIYLNTLKINEDLILLESQHGLEIDGNIYYIAKELLSNPVYSRYTICISARNRKVKQRILERFVDIDCSRLKIVKFASYAYYRMVASAKYLINDNTFKSFFVKRDEQIYVNVWHGTPLKGLGKSDFENLNAIGNAQKNFFMADYLLYPNEYTRDHMIEDYMVENLSNAKVLIGGYPRNTAFFNEGSRAAIREKENFGSKSVYAYMPTWRSETFENQEKLESVLREIDRSLQDNELFYIKLHPIATERIKLRKYRHIRPFPEQYETYEFLNAVDCLVTDYSSVMFDYANTGRKIVLYTYDEEQYCSLRGMYMELEALPFAKVRTNDALFNELRNGVVGDYSELRNSLCRYDSADAAEAICRRTILGEDAGFVEGEIPHNDKDNVIIYSGNLAPNGVTLSLLSMLRQLDTSKYNYYLTFTGSQTEDYKSVLYSLPNGVKYISCVGKMNATFTEKVAIILYGMRRMSFDRFLKRTEKAYKLEYRRIYAHNTFATSIQYSGYNYKKILSFLDHGGNRIIFVHNDMKREIETRGNQREEVLRYSYPKYERVVAVSQEIGKKTQDFIGRLDNLSVIHNLIDVDGIIRKSKMDVSYKDSTILNVVPEEIDRILKSDAFKFVNVGRFSPEKGHERLIRAFDKYYRKNRNSYLIIIGGNQWMGTYDMLRDKLLPKLDCHNNVVMILDVDNPFAIMNRCDGFIFSSLYEGFGMVLMEAAALEMPVASVELEASKPFLLENGGHVVENSEEGVYEGLEWLASDKAVRMHADFRKYNQSNASMLKSLFGDSEAGVTEAGEANSEIAESFIDFRKIKKLEDRNYLAWKASGGKVEFRKTQNGVDRYYENFFLGSLENDFFRIRNLDIRQDVLNIEGSVGFYGVQADEVVTVAVVDGDRTYNAELIDRNHERNEGISMRVVVFRCKLPLNESEHRLTINVSVKGFEFEEHKLIFDQYSPIGTADDGYENSYYYRDGWSIRTDGRAILVNECSEKERLNLEKNYAHELRKLGSKGKKLASLRSKAIEFESKKNKPIWLVNDRIVEAGDNGEAFFIYINEHHKDDVDSYFVISKDSDDYARMQKYGKVIEYGSDEHRLLMLSADAIISSHSDVVFRKFEGEENRIMRDLLHTPFILLEHGMAPGKDFHTWLHRSNTMISGFAVASEEEFVQYSDDKYGYSEEELWVTGLPRFDRLEDRTKKLITVMPTWRKELCKEKDPETGLRPLRDDFIYSQYARFWKAFMENESLNETAKRLGYEIVFRAHPMFRHQENHFGFEDFVRIGDDDKPYRDIISETALLVTDYSGVAFDFGYIEKPVVYAQFENVGLTRTNHTYRMEDSYDYLEKGFGEVEVTADETAKRVVEYMESGCRIKPEYLKRIDDLYKYRDKHNCERVYDRICQCVEVHGV